MATDIFDFQTIIERVLELLPRWSNGLSAWLLFVRSRIHIPDQPNLTQYCKGLTNLNICK